MRALVDIEDLLVWAFRNEAVELSPATHPDAELVFQAVSALPARHSTIVRMCARSGRRPNWDVDTDKRVVWLTEVRLARQSYADWVRALGVLAESLDGLLEYFAVTGPALDEEPWRGRKRA